MRWTSASLLLASLWTAARTLPAQTEAVRFEKLSIEQGLSQSSVTAICQDRRGFLWFGTYAGINRYDGYDFRIFRHDPDDSTSLIQNVIKDVKEDRTGALWIATDGGLDRFDRASESFIHYVHDPRDSTSLSFNRVRNVFEDRAGRLWIATDNGLNRYDREADRFVRYFHDPSDPASLCDNKVREIYEDRLGNLWIGTDSGLELLDRETGRFRHFRAVPGDPSSLSGNHVISFGEDRAGGLWIGTWDRGLNRLDRRTWKFKRYMADPKNPSSLRYNTVRAIFEDRSGVLWIGTYGGGLERYDRETDGFIHYRANPDDPGSLSSDAVWCIDEDASGILWIGTDFGGVDKFDRRRNQFGYYRSRLGPPGGRYQNAVNALYADPDDRGNVIWIGTWGAGLSRLNRRTGENVRYKNDPFDRRSLSNDVIRCIMEDRAGFLWIGTDGGLNRLDRGTGRVDRYLCEPGNPNTLDYDNIFCVCEDSRGNLWVGSYYGGLNRLDRRTGRFIRYRADPKNPDAFNDNIVWCIHEDRAGRIWIGTDAGGLNRLDPATGRFVHYTRKPDDPNSLSDNKVISIFEDAAGVLWLGTPGGLNRFDPATERFRRYTIADGLASDAVQSIAGDDQGYLWIGTTKGLSRFDSRKNAFVTFNANDGLQGDEFSVGACASSVSGEMFFGGTNGFNAFFPEKVKLNGFIPPVVLTDFQLFNRSVPVGRKIDGRVILPRSVTETSEIALSHRQDDFSIQYAALSFSAPDRNAYAYRLVGLEKEWNLVGNRRFAMYNRLPPGRYEFQVKGSNNDGVWNGQAVSLTIRIRPPFWKTAWFILLSAMTALGLAAAGYFNRVGKIRVRNRELERRVRERTRQLEEANSELEAFTYSVSHDLRSPLRAMDGFSQALLEEYAPGLDARGADYLRRIRRGSQHLGRLIDDLLKLSRLARSEMKFVSIDIGRLAESVAEELKQSDPSRDAEFVIAKDETVQGDAELLKVMLGNLLGNAWKFSSKRPVTRIQFGVLREDDRRTFFVRDNGIGLDMNYADKLFKPFQRLQTDFEGTGIGLTTVHRIIRRHGGRIWADGKPDGGATFYFTLGTADSPDGPETRASGATAGTPGPF
jgi:ligand-binding sensor domain-containing protein/signal transduction histidine kinase